MIPINVRIDGSEKVKYDYDGYYAYVRRAFLSSYPNYIANSHWHDDLEFIYVLAGSIDYNVNGEIVKIQEGNGILVNGRQIHYGFSCKKKECEFICVLLHPMLLCASQNIKQDLVLPIISDEYLPYILLDKKVLWQKQILDNIYTIYTSKELKTAQLHIQSAFYNIWILLTENAIEIKHSVNKQDRRLDILKDMLLCIQMNYSEKLSLDDIAYAGNVSKSTCLIIFKRYLQDTPTNYLINYRLKKSMQLLRETDKAISEIALLVGFSGISYFTETFRKNLGMTPREYRAKNIN